MLLKSTGSLRRKRAENSPVCRTGNRGKGIHGRTTHRPHGSRDGVKITRIHMWKAHYQVELVQNLELIQRFRPNCCQRFFEFYIKHLKIWQFWQTLTTEGQNKQRLSSTGSPLLFSLPTSDWRRQSTDILTSTLWHSCCHCASRKQIVTRGCGQWSSTSGGCSLFGTKHLQTQRCGYELTGKIITSAFADQHSCVKETKTSSTVLNWL